MISYHLENLTKVKGELKPLLEQHWELVAMYQDKIKLNPDWKEYSRLDAAGMLRIFTARDNGDLVGYFVLIVSKSLHYSDHYFASNDVIFVKPDSRAGATGYKLLKYVEDYCSDCGVSMLTINTKAAVPFDSLLTSNSYDLAERVYTKYLGT
jgi:GNAT superfamily N-acetyltransferase